MGKVQEREISSGEREREREENVLGSGIVNVVSEIIEQRLAIANRK